MVGPGTLISHNGPREWRTRSVAETEALGRELASELVPDGTLLLIGDLGAGKTVLARGIATGLGIDEREVQSPTYTLIREHEGPLGSLIHVDLYRLDPSDIGELGLEEILSGPGVKVVEWADRIPFPVPGAVRWRMEVEDTGRIRVIRDISQAGRLQDGPNSSTIAVDPE